MAIIKALDTKFGIQASYHRITAFSINYSAKKIVICVSTYLSKEARQNQNDPIEEIDIEVPQVDYHTFLNTNPIEHGYIWLKQNVIGFDDSMDDYEVIEPVLKHLEVQEDE